MEKILETKQICDMAGLTYDGISIGMSDDMAKELNMSYNAYCMGMSIDEYKKAIAEHESKMQEGFKNRKIQNRHWGR